MIRITWKIKSLIFLLVLLCVPAAIALNCEAATYNGDVSVTSGDSHVTSKSTAQVTMHDGKVSAVTSTITMSRVNKGGVYTISLNEGSSTGCKWTVTSSDGFILLSDTLGPEGNRVLKFRADKTGRQTISADCSKSGTENLKYTSDFVLNVD